MMTSTIMGVIRPRRSPSLKLSLIRKNLPVFFKLLLLFIMGQIELHRNKTDVIIGQCPYIRVGAFVEINELACKPVIFTSVRIFSLNKILFIFCIGLPADLYPFYLVNGGNGNIHI